MLIPGNIVRVLFYISAVLFGPAAHAQVATANLSVQIIITGGCAVQNVSGVNFGSFPLLTSNIDNTGSFDVVCTTGFRTRSLSTAAGEDQSVPGA